MYKLCLPRPPFVLPRLSFRFTKNDGRVVLKGKRLVIPWQCCVVVSAEHCALGGSCIFMYHSWCMFLLFFDDELCLPTLDLLPPSSPHVLSDPTAPRLLKANLNPPLVFRFDFRSRWTRRVFHFLPTFASGWNKWVLGFGFLVHIFTSPSRVLGYTDFYSDPETSLTAAKWKGLRYRMLSKPFHHSKTRPDDS